MGTRRILSVAVGAALLALLAGCSDDDADVGGSSGGAAAGGGGPEAEVDHWHAAFGIYVCDEFLPNIPESESPLGIHTHGDGLVHIHPFSEDGAGRNATLDAFLHDTDVTVEEDGLVVDSTRHDEGDDCGGKPAEVQVAWWEDVAGDHEPRIVTDDFDDLRFAQDGEGFTIAFVPEGAEIPKPPTVDAMTTLGDVDGPVNSPPPSDPVDPSAFPVHDPAVQVDDGFYPVVAVAAGACEGLDTLVGQHVPGPDGQCYGLDVAHGIGREVIESASKDIPQGRWEVALVLTDDGIDRFNELAGLCYVGGQGPSCPLAQVAIVANGKVVTAPIINSPSFERDAISVTGNFTEDEAEAVAAALSPH